MDLKEYKIGMKELRKRVTEYNCHSKSSKNLHEGFFILFFSRKEDSALERIFIIHSYKEKS